MPPANDAASPYLPASPHRWRLPRVATPRFQGETFWAGEVEPNTMPFRP